MGQQCLASLSSLPTKEVSTAKGCRTANVMKTRLPGANWAPATEPGLPLANREVGGTEEMTEPDSITPPHQGPAPLWRQTSRTELKEWEVMSPASSTASPQLPREDVVLCGLVAFSLRKEPGREGGKLSSAPYSCCSPAASLIALHLPWQALGCD